MQVTKTILAAAIGLGISAGAFAEVLPAPAVTIGGAATSAVSGSAVAFSSVTGVNQTAAHSAFSSSSNYYTKVGGDVDVVGYKKYFSEASGAELDTFAKTSGETSTSAYGKGTGVASANAYQSGFGQIEATVSDTTGNTEFYGKAISAAGTFTGSGAEVVNNGFMLSGSWGKAKDTTYVNLSSGVHNDEVWTIANGNTFPEYSDVGTWGFLSFGNDSTSGFATALAYGSHSGVITRGSSEASTPDVIPVNTVHPNNGWGNGNQAAPGNSLVHNNAENGPDGQPN